VRRNRRCHKKLLLAAQKFLPTFAKILINGPAAIDIGGME
jgi:hypothetical protein